MYAAYIAIDEYQDPSIPNLKSCVNDGILLEKNLKKLGYRTLHILSNKEATKQNIEKAFDHIYNVLKTKKNSSFILYIAGHGCKKEGFDKFLCNDYSQNEMISTTFDYDIINKYTKKFNSKHQLLLADSCFSGSLVKEPLREEPWNEEIANSRSMHVISSVQNSGKAIEHKENGVFTKSFVSSLNELLENENYIKISDISKVLEKRIIKELLSINIEMDQTHIPKIGRLYKEITSRDNQREKINLDGEILFFQPIALFNARTRSSGYDYDYESADDEEVQGTWSLD